MIKLKGVFKHYHNNNKVVTGLSDVNLEFKNNGLYLITGESGSGKSTLLNILSGNDEITDGTFLVDGKDTDYFDEEDWDNYRKNYVSCIKQDLELLPNYTTIENIECANNLVNGNNSSSIVEDAIDKVKISPLRRIKVKKISGGQKQRVSIARALVKNTPIVIADEPTSNLDSFNSKKIVEIFKDISKNKIVIVVSHDEDIFEDMFDTKIVLLDGKIKEVIDKNKSSKEVKIEEKKQSKSKIYGLFKNLSYVLSLAIFTFITMFVTFTLYSASLDSIYSLNNSTVSHEVYKNITDDRYIVTKNDGTPFNEDDFNYFKNKEGFSSFLKQDILADHYATIVTDRNGTRLDEGRAIYIRSIDEIENVEYGIMPRIENDVVYAPYGGYIGPTIDNPEFEDKIYIKEGREYIINTVGKVTQKTESYTETYYFTNTLLESLYADYASLFFKHTFVLNDEEVTANRVYLDSKVEKGKVYINNDGLVNSSIKTIIDDSINIVANEQFECKKLENNTYNQNSLNEKDIIAVFNEQEYIDIINKQFYQISVISNTKIESTNKYNVYYPAEYLKIRDLTGSVLTGTLFIALTLLLGSLLSVLTFYFINRLSKQEIYCYKVFNSIGYAKKDIKKQILLRNGIPLAINYILIVALFILFDFLSKYGKAIGSTALKAIFTGSIPIYQIIFIPFFFFFMFYYLVCSNQMRKFDNSKREK